MGYDVLRTNVPYSGFIKPCPLWSGILLSRSFEIGGIIPSRTGGTLLKVATWRIQEYLVEPGLTIMDEPNESKRMH